LPIECFQVLDKYLLFPQSLLSTCVLTSPSQETTNQLRNHQLRNHQTSFPTFSEVLFLPLTSGGRIAPKSRGSVPRFRLALIPQPQHQNSQPPLRVSPMNHWPRWIHFNVATFQVSYDSGRVYCSFSGLCITFLFN